MRSDVRRDKEKTTNIFWIFLQSNSQCKEILKVMMARYFNNIDEENGSKTISAKLNYFLGAEHVEQW